MSSGKRYSKDEKESIMYYRQTHTYQETAQKYSVSQMSLARWSRKFKNSNFAGDRYSGDPAYKTFLHVLKYLKGVKAVALYSGMTDGSTLASITDNSISEDVLFLSISALLAATDRSTQELSLGGLNMVLLKNKEGFLFIRDIDPSLQVIIVYDGSTNINSIVTQDFPLIERVRQDISNLAT